MSSVPVSRQDRAGMTLVELVVALAVLSLAVGAIFGVVGLAVRSTSMTMQLQDLQHNARVAVDRIIEEVRWGGAPQANAGGFLETAPYALSVTIPPDPEYPGCLRLCRPYPEEDPGRAYAVRFVFDSKTRTIRRQVDATGRFLDHRWIPGAWEPRDGHIIADHVSLLHFRYFNRDGDPTDSQTDAIRVNMRVEVAMGRHHRALTADVFPRQK
ncbi:MAG: type II secretion system protein [Acidobacteria bacterium]|nr:type II secretion system protein [Acidobacteriota bacterium]